MATSRVQTLRSSTAGARPSAGARQPGELFINFPDLALGVVDAGQSPVDLVAVRYFSASAGYLTGDYVVRSGVLYRAKANISAGAFNAVNWDAVVTFSQLLSVDGAGSGLDADLLDGQQGVFYLDLANATGVLPSDATHGVRGGGGLHSVATSASAGFLSGSDKSKLDAVEAGATGDMTAAEILASVKTVDGVGSGLDADLLDGQSSAFYQDAANINAGTLPVGRINDVSHGNLGGGNLHALATSAARGFFVDAASDSKQYVRKNAAWQEVVVPPNTFVGDAPPPTPADGQLWWESDTGRLFIYFNDGNSLQWVQINVAGNQGPITVDAPSDGNSYFRQDGVWSATIVQLTGGIIAHKGQPAVGYVRQKGTTGSDSFVWRVTDDGTSGGANSKAKMTLTDAPDTSLNLVGTSPLVGFYPGAGGTRVGYVQAVNGGALTINGETTNVNILAAAALYVGPRTTAVGGGARQYISYLGLAAQWGLNLVAESAAGTSTAIAFTYPPSTVVGAISHTATTTTYGTTSDERLKDFDGPLTGDEAAAIIRADPVRHFTWKYDGSAAVGWSAQASYAVSQDLAVPGDDLGPDAKSGDEGFHPWGVDQAKRTPYLWAALAHALDKIDDLEARLAAVETR